MFNKQSVILFALIHQYILMKTNIINTARNYLLILPILLSASSLDAQNLGIGTADPTEKLEVNGRIAAKGYKFAIHEANGNAFPNVTLSGTNSWQDFPNLTINFTLDTTTTVLAHYSISGPLNSSFLVTKLVIDSIDPNETGVAHSVQGNFEYGTNSGQYITELPPGNHTVKVIYRTPATISYQGSDWQNRVLQVLVYGSN